MRIYGLIRYASVLMVIVLRLIFMLPMHVITRIAENAFVADLYKRTNEQMTMKR